MIAFGRKTPLEFLLDSIGRAGDNFDKLSKKDFKDIHPDPCWVLESSDAATWVGICSISVLVFSEMETALKYIEREGLAEGFVPKEYAWNDIVRALDKSGLLAVIDYTGESFSKIKCVPLIRD